MNEAEKKKKKRKNDNDAILIETCIGIENVIE